MKYKRQNRIVKLIQEQPIKTHEQLVEILENEGMRVTQATISRDIKELGIIKAPSPDGGSMYAMPPAMKNRNSEDIPAFSNAIINVECAMNIVVIKTYPGMASAMCASIDDKLHTDFVGSIAGDDTIMIVAHTPEQAEAFSKKLRNIYR